MGVRRVWLRALCARHTASSKRLVTQLLRRGAGRSGPRRLSRRATRSADAAGRSQKLMAQSRPLVAGGTPARCTCAERDGAIRGVRSGVTSACRSSGSMGEAWGGHLSVGLDAGRQPQNRPTTAALARLERSRRAGIIARTSGTTSMPLASSIGRRWQKLVIAKLGLRLRSWCIRLKLQKMAQDPQVPCAWRCRRPTRSTVRRAHASSSRPALRLPA